MGEDIRAGSLITIDQGMGQHSLVYCSEQDGRCQMGKEIDDTQAKVSFPYGWRKGDTCVIITNKAKRALPNILWKAMTEYISEFEAILDYIIGYLRGGCSRRKRMHLKVLRSRNMEVCHFKIRKSILNIPHSIASALKMVFFHNRTTGTNVLK